MKGDGVTEQQNYVALKQLERFFVNLGWYSGRPKFTITIEGGFEAFSGRASETWEHKVTIELPEIKSDTKVICPHIKRTGGVYDSMEVVAAQVLLDLKQWQSKQKENDSQ